MGSALDCSERQGCRPRRYNGTACLAAQRFYQVDCCGVNLEWTAARFFRAYPWVWQLILALLGVRARSAGPGRTAHGLAAV